MQKIYVYYFKDEDKQRLGKDYEQGRCYGYNNINQGSGLAVNKPTNDMLEHIDDYVVENNELVHKPKQRKLESAYDLKIMEEMLEKKDLQIKELIERTEAIETVIAQLSK